LSDILAVCWPIAFHFEGPTTRSKMSVGAKIDEEVCCQLGCKPNFLLRKSSAVTASDQQRHHAPWVKGIGQNWVPMGLRVNEDCPDNHKCSDSRHDSHFYPQTVAAKVPFEVNA